MKIINNNFIDKLFYYFNKNPNDFSNKSNLSLLIIYVLELNKIIYESKINKIDIKCFSINYKKLDEYTDFLKNFNSTFGEEIFFRYKIIINFAILEFNNIFTLSLAMDYDMNNYYNNFEDNYYDAQCRLHIKFYNFLKFKFKNQNIMY